MQSKAATVDQYLAELAPDRRAALSAIRDVILKNLDTRGPDGKGGFEEGMGYGMMGYYVPHSVYPPGYHCDARQGLPFAGLASQKNYMSVYLMYAQAPGEEAWLHDQFANAGKKLDMGKCCIRFKALEDLPVSVIGEAIRRVSAKTFIDFYERALLPTGKGASRKPANTAKKTKASAANTSTKSSAPKAKTAKPVKVASTAKAKITNTKASPKSKTNPKPSAPKKTAKRAAATPKKKAARSRAAR